MISIDDIYNIFRILAAHWQQVSATGAGAVLAFGIYKFYAERKTALYWREFEIYHKLVKELVESESQSGEIYSDRQTAILYELKNFSRYYPHSLRMLKGLREQWDKTPGRFPRLIEELDIAIATISKKHTSLIDLISVGFLPVKYLWRLIERLWDRGG